MIGLRTSGHTQGPPGPIERPQLDHAATLTVRSLIDNVD
jgi:hypothetical protein